MKPKRYSIRRVAPRRVLLACLAALSPASATAAVTPSISDATNFPAAPAFETFNPVATPAIAERTVVTLLTGEGDPRILTQTFRLGEAINLGAIHLLYVRGVSGELFRVRIFPVTDTLAAQGATAGILTDYDNAVANGFLLDATVAMPTTENDNTERLLTLDLTGADVVALPATSGTAGYGIALSSVKDDTSANDEVFTWRFGQTSPSSSAGPYADGRLYYDAPGGAQGGGNRDATLALVEVFIDSDGDLMPDAWELANGTDPDVNDAAVDNDANGGPDNLTNLEEYQNHTDPNDSDSDDDGLPDGTEVKALHASGFDSDPLSADSDADGASDLAEHTGSLNTQFANAPTDPLAADSDGDGMDDGYELTCNSPGTALDPNDDGTTDPAQATTGDRDGDGLANLEEFDPSLGPNTASPQTRADLADTDGDGYQDMHEDNFGAWGGPFLTGTNPTLADTDGDGLDDGDENPDTGTPGGIPYNSDPTKMDTDGDTFGDKFEIDHSSNPNDAGSTPPQPAGFTLVEDFEGEDMVIGQSFNGVNGWATAVPAIAMVADEPIAGGDKVGGVVRVAGSSYSVSKALPPMGLQILEGNTGTLFMQVYCSSANHDNSFGLSDQAAPASGDFGAYEAQTVAHLSNNLRLRDSAAFVDVATYPAGRWMNVWIVADNAADTLTVHVESPAGQSGPVEISASVPEAPVGFRNGTADALSSVLLMVATGAEAGSVLYIDNIHVDPAAANLATPAAAKPLPPAAPQVTSVAFEGGDLKIKFTPGGAGYILTSSDDLVSPFTEETGATYDGIDTFTVPAAALNPGRDFFRVEGP